MMAVPQGMEARALAWELVDLPINNSVTLGKNLSSSSLLFFPKWKEFIGCFIRLLPTLPS